MEKFNLLEEAVIILPIGSDSAQKIEEAADKVTKTLISTYPGLKFNNNIEGLKDQMAELLFSIQSLHHSIRVRIEEPDDSNNMRHYKELLKAVDYIIFFLNGNPYNKFELKNSLELYRTTLSTDSSLQYIIHVLFMFFA